jgi:hypothetical protein
MLQLISGEETTADWGLWYRMGDVCAGVLLLLAVWRFGWLRRNRLAGWALVAIAVLSAVDGIFPDTCYFGHGSCSLVAAGLSAVHDVETVLLVGLLAVLSIVDALRQRRAASTGFVALQVALAAIVVSGLASLWRSPTVFFQKMPTVRRRLEFWRIGLLCRHSKF